MRPLFSTRRRFGLALLALLTLATVHFVIPANSAEKEPRWASAIKAFEDADKVNPPPKDATVFVGSSSIRRWETLARDFPDRRVINRGFGGSFLEDVATYAERLIVACHPKTVVIYAGGNDINGGRTPAQVLASFKAIMAKIRPALPDTQIFYVSINPSIARWKQAEQIKQANQLVSDEIKTLNDPKLEYIDSFPALLGEDGKPLPDIFVADNLHLNPKGYAIWTKVIKPRLK